MLGKENDVDRTDGMDEIITNNPSNDVFLSSQLNDIIGVFQLFTSEFEMLSKNLE